MLVTSELEVGGWYWERYAESFREFENTLLLKLVNGLIFKLNMHIFYS